MMRHLLVFISLLIHATLAKQNHQQQGSSKKWLTLNGGRPSVIARGGFSGIFPESSSYAAQLAKGTSLPDVILFCNLQLSKDSIGFCQTGIELQNQTNIAKVFPKGEKTYNVNGNKVGGWFALDYTADQLINNLTFGQSVFARPIIFDGLLPLSTVESGLLLGEKNAPRSWLNVQYDAFYSEHKISIQSYLQGLLKTAAINYISSPEIGFLKSMGRKLNKAKTKLIFQVLEDPNAVEPTTKQTYGSILKDLNAIKSFASGILVPKDYIWPVNKSNYLKSTPTTLVNDAHKLGLEVHASGFANDILTSFNYSYDPTAEYLQFIDNSQFSVDGLLTDFPSTASETIACFAQNNATSKPNKGKTLIITHNGASGIYPGATDLAYQQAVDDGADIIDCSVQMSKDGVAFCLNSANLRGKTNAITSFMSRTSNVPEIQIDDGIFSFDLTWTEIQTLKPEMASPYAVVSDLPRNPAAKNQGKLMSLDGFLEFAKAKSVSGILINIENAAYLASKKGLSIVDAVTKALSDASFDKQSTQQVLIQSDDTSVLSKFSDVSTYKRVWTLLKPGSAVPKDTVDEIKKYASAVVVARPLLITHEQGFAKAYTNIFKDLHNANIFVYVTTFMNEFVTLAFDYFSDPIVQLATYVGGLGVDGIITEYPATASKYLRSPCSDLNAKLEYTILPIEPGSLLGLLPPELQPPASAPEPQISVADVVDPPLPPVSIATTSPNPTAETPPTPTSSSGKANVAHICVALVTIMACSLRSL